MARHRRIGIPAHAHAVAAGLLARAGDLAGARLTLDVVLDLDTWRQDRSYLWSVFVGHMATAAVALQDHEVCETLVAELEPVASSCAVNGAVVAFGGSNALRVGTLLAALGRVNDARGHLTCLLGCGVWRGRRQRVLLHFPAGQGRR
jgi:hypothetical protein